jgi:hypothetical protein
MQTKLSKQQGNERPQDKRSFVLRIHVRYDNQQQKNMGSRQKAKQDGGMLGFFFKRLSKS